MSSDNSVKLIVRNLSFDSKDEDVQKYYEQWGTVDSCEIKRHKDTKKSKGFAVIQYLKAAMVDEAMSSRPHELDGRTLEPHRAGPLDYSKRLESHHTCNEIFVGDYKEDIEESDLNEYFSKFGNVEEVTIPKDKNDETKIRGFAIVKFDDYDPVDVCCHKRKHHIKDHELHITKYIDRKTMNQLKQRFGRNDYNNGNSQRELLEQVMQTLLGGGGQNFRGKQRGRGGGRGRKPYNRN